MTNKTCTIVHGPQGCGKTTNAERIAKAYGCSKIEDMGKHGKMYVEPEKIAPGTLILSVEEPDLGRNRFGFPVRVVTYKVAMEMVDIDESGRG